MADCAWLKPAEIACDTPPPPDDVPYWATDTRGIAAASGPCNHRSCIGSPTGCRAWSDATFEVTPADAAFAGDLVASGWWSTSSKSRTIARWRETVPPLEQMFRPEFLATFHGQRIAKVVAQHLSGHYGCSGPNAAPHLEHACLSPSLFKAFKHAGGDCAR